jgi:hypothetical protein
MNSLYNVSVKNKHPFVRLSLIPEAHLKQKIQCIRNIDLATSNIEQLKCKFKELLSYQIRLVLGYSFHYYYRAQKTDSNKLSRLIHAPIELVDKEGRCNNIGESLFYCSNSYVTSILEQKAQIGETVTILITELPNYNNTNHSPPLIFLAKEEIRDNIMNSFTVSDQKQVNKKLKIIEDYFTEVMTTEVAPGDEWSYKTSIALSKACFESTENSHLGLAFPSMASKKFGLNFALTPAWSKIVNDPRNSKLMAFQIKIVDKIGDFNSMALITHIAHEIDGEGCFVFADVSSYQKIIMLNTTFFEAHEQNFKRQKQTLKEGSIFYRRYAPPEYFFSTSINVNL